MELAVELSKRDHEVHVISYAMPFRRDQTENIRFHEVAVPSYPLFKYPPYDMALASKLAEVAVQHRLQVLHAHYAIPHSMAAFLAREMVGDRSVAVVTTLHGTDVTLVGADPSYRTATRFALGKSLGITAVSRYLAQVTEELCGGCAPIEVIYNFVDTERFAPLPDKPGRERYAGSGEALLMHASNFRPVKRVGDVVAVFAGIQSRIPARLLMIGDGPERQAAERQAAALGVGDRVEFTGPLPDTSRVLPLADAFLLPSDGESFGLAALEAMACGVPVVGARAGGLPEVVEDGRCGILEAVGDTAAMTGRLAALLGEPSRAASWGLAARERAVREFCSRRIVPLYESVYARALGESRRRPAGAPPSR